MNPPFYTFLLRRVSEIDKYGPPLYTLARRGYSTRAASARGVPSRDLYLHPPKQDDALSPAPHLEG